MDAAGVMYEGLWPCFWSQKASLTDFFNERKRGRRQTLRGGSLRARLNGPARVDAWRLGCRKVMADQAAGAAV